MKRSEMIESIRAILLDDLNFDMEYDHVDYLLSKIEDRGMLPPERENSLGLIDVDGNTVYVNIWEDEDE